MVKPVVTSDIETIFARGDRGINSHVPTSLRFLSRQKDVIRARRISDGTIENPNFAPYTSDLFARGLSLRPDMNPLEKLRLLSHAMVGAAEKIFKDKRHEISKVVVFQKAAFRQATLWILKSSI